MITITDIMHHCRNFFADEEAAQDGTFTIEDGSLTTAFQDYDYDYVLIEGSKHNDGVYQIPTTELRDEAFTGRITPLCPPPDFLQLCKDIQDWHTAYKNASKSPFQSESFDGYSYTLKSGNNGDFVNWKTIWKAELNRYRKI